MKKRVSQELPSEEGLRSKYSNVVGLAVADFLVDPYYATQIAKAANSARKKRAEDQS